jgi:AraC-like DNA-binding protein
MHRSIVEGRRALARIDHRNRARYWNAPNFDGLSCLCADFTAHDFAPHSHEALVIAVTEVGGAEVRSRGEVIEASNAILQVFNPAEPHSGRMGRSKRWRYRGLYLAQPALEKLGSTLGTDAIPYCTANAIRDGRLIGSFRDLHVALENGTDPLLGQERLAASFGQLFRRYGSQGERIALGSRDGGPLSSIQMLMRDRYREQITLEEMGRVVGLTPFQLIGLFKRTIGLTPHAYLTQVRLEAALREMGHGASIAEAALSAGFYDQSALTNHFKRAYGITPLQWVRAARG